MQRSIRTLRSAVSSRGALTITGSVATACFLIGVAGLPAAAQLNLTWTDASTNEDGFTVERKTGSSSAYVQLASLAPGTTGYVDMTVTEGNTYCYRVRAYNSAGNSAYSNEACATPATATRYTVTVVKNGTGSGTVASSPGGIDCGNTCSASIAAGTSLAVSATPATGFTFAGWSGACTGTQNCALVVDGNTTLTATFVPTLSNSSASTPSTSSTSTTSTAILTLTKTGNGSGIVASTPAGIYCGDTCTASFPSAASVTLAVVTTERSTFARWSGACTGTTATCTVTMDAAKSVTATFTQKQWRRAIR